MTFEELARIVADPSFGEDALIARLVEINGFGGGDRDANFAVVAGETVLGRLVSTGVTREIAARARGESGMLSVALSDPSAVAQGLACGGVVSAMYHPARWLPSLADLIARRVPFALVTTLDGDTVRPPVRLVSLGARPTDALGEEVYDLLARGRVGIVTLAIEGSTAHVQAFAPRPMLFVLGLGDLAEALAAQGALVGIEVRATDDPAEIGALGPTDGLVVLTHDHEVATPVLARVLGATQGGYVGSLGSRHTQRERIARLVAAGVADPESRIFGPAGLAIGSRTSQETALAIVAEMLAVIRGRKGGHLRDDAGPING
jgi:xanthine dehydrogenase accessory factor